MRGRGMKRILMVTILVLFGGSGVFAAPFPDQYYQGDRKPKERERVKETDKKYWGGEPAGYRFDGTDGARGAVEMMKPGRIWYTEKMAEAEREPGTCLLAGLMLYMEPADKDD